MSDLCIAHKNGRKFNLEDRIAGNWKTIGLTLGIGYYKLDNIESENDKHVERLRKVLNVWLEDAGQLPHKGEYPLSWSGLNTLLEDSGKMEIAKQYFEFLNEV